MKTSNKLLLGLFAVIIIGMVAANIFFKNEVEKSKGFNNRIEMKVQTDSITNDSISVQ